MAEQTNTIEVMTKVGMQVHYGHSFRVDALGALIIRSEAGEVAAYPAGYWFQAYETGNLKK